MFSMLNEVFAKHKFSPRLWESPLMRQIHLAVFKLLVADDC